jgi:SAM-dependent methyltransferase
MSEYTKANENAWDVASGFHQDAMMEKWITGFESEGHTVFSEFEKDVYSKISFKDKSIFHAPCNNGRELLSLLNMGARQGLGIDISGENIKVAQKLHKVSGGSAEFIHGDIYDVSNKISEKYDLGLVTVGSLNWMENLKEYFSAIKSNLVGNGELILLEMHPVAYVFPYTFNKNHEVKLDLPYFSKAPIVSTGSLDYYGNVEYESPKMYEFQHTISDIIKALILLDFTIIDFVEYPIDLAGGHGYLEKKGMVPLSFFLRAKLK